MHSWSYKDYRGDKFMFFFNGDFSGDIHISDHSTDEEIIIPSDVLLEFITENYIRPRQMARIENIDWKDLIENL